MTEEDWKSGFAKSLGIFLYGGGLHTVDQLNNPVVDDSFYIILNAHYETLEFRLPTDKYGKKWNVVFDTGCPGLKKEYAAGGRLKAGDRSMIVLQSKLQLPG